MNYENQSGYEEYEVPRKVSMLRLLISLFILAILAFIGFLYFMGIIQLYHVNSASMEPTLQIGDRIFVDGQGVVEQFDIIAFLHPKTDESYVKRVIGLGGDEIQLKDGILYINGEEQYSRFIRGNKINWRDTRVTLKYDELFVLGDNRNDTEDSLNFGPIKTDRVSGVLRYILWPKDRWGKVNRIDEMEEALEEEE